MMNVNHNENHLIITPQQFIDDNYAPRIKQGQCGVILFVKEPGVDAPTSHKEAYDEMLRRYGNLVYVENMTVSDPTTEVEHEMHDHNGQTITTYDLKIEGRNQVMRVSNELKMLVRTYNQ